MRPIPNTILPKGAILLSDPETLNLGSWSSMTYDAKVERLGVTWYRVKGGMGERNDREDWCADIPSGALCVHDYHWNGNSFGPNYGSFDGAILGQTKAILDVQKGRVVELTGRLIAVKKAVQLLTRVVACA